jgi:Na+-driven multidrug efflux pump
MALNPAIQPHNPHTPQLTNLLGYVVNAVGVSFVGRLGGLQLSAAVLAQSIFNVTGARLGGWLPLGTGSMRPDSPAFV